VRLATYRKGKAARLGIVWGDKVIDYNAGARLMSPKGKGAARAFADVDLRGFLSQGASAIRMAKKVEAWVGKQSAGKSRPSLKSWVFDLAKVKLLPPLNNPAKILCLARNYASHIREVSEVDPLPEDILVFMKPATAIIGPDDPVVIPPECRLLDHEVELALVVGKRGRNIPEEKAMGHLAGYTILNDISDREYRRMKNPPHHVNWFFMKAQDTFAPLGPFLVGKEEIQDPHTLRLRLWVNGELRQDSAREEMIFKVPTILSRISRFVTLEPGDIIGTGTPTGTSFGTQKYLKGGDVVECEIEGIGRLRNVIRMEEPAYRTR
jgi:2-keto-4-pentenoate hydratase/2-oxohepta-3-ene-1,7-dioic acid hydratase in catechol pathway